MKLLKLKGSTIKMFKSKGKWNLAESETIECKVCWKCPTDLGGAKLCEKESQVLLKNTLLMEVM